MPEYPVLLVLLVSNQRTNRQGSFIGSLTFGVSLVKLYLPSLHFGRILSLPSRAVLYRSLEPEERTNASCKVGPRLPVGGVPLWLSHSASLLDAYTSLFKKENLQLLSLYHTGYLHQTENQSGKNNYIVLGIHPMATGFDYGGTPKAV